jgi:integrase
VGELGAIIARRWEARSESPYVFHRHGRPIRGLRKAWGTACKTAGKPRLLFHDLRRSAVRNLVAAGVDQTVAMRISGHKTVSVFQRYRIVADEDVRAALARTEASTQSVADGSAGGPNPAIGGQ